MKLFLIVLNKLYLTVIIECLNVRLPTYGRFTLKMSYSAENNFYLKYGNLIFNFTQTRILLNKKNFSDKKYKNFSFMATSHIWMSVNLIHSHNIKENFIRLGHDFVFLNNTLYEYRPNDLFTLKIIRSVSSIEIDPFINLFNYTVDSFSIIKDPSFKIYSQYRQKIDPNEYPTTKYNLPIQLKSIYELVKNLSPELSQLELDAVQFSHDTYGCLLNQDNKPFLVRFNNMDEKNSFFFIEIFAKNYLTPVKDNFNIFAIYKVLDGSMKVEFYNSINDSSSSVKNKILVTDDMAWFSPDWYRIFRIKNIHSSKPLIIVKSLADEQISSKFLNSVIEYNQFRTIVLREYLSKTCSTVTSNCCQYTGSICGRKLLENKCSGKEFRSDGLYYCSKENNRVTLIKLCDELCDQELKSAMCTQKFQARSLLVQNELDQRIQESRNVWMQVLVQNMNKTSLFVVKFYTGEKCGYADQVPVIYFLSKLGDLSVDSNTNGTISVIIRLNISVIKSTGDTDYFEQFFVNMTKGKFSCASIDRFDVSNTLATTEKLIEDQPRNVLYAKWEDPKANRKFLSYDNGLKWTEFNGDKVFAEFRLVKFEKDGAIVYDDKRNFYVKISDSFIKWGNSISTINWKFGNGKWILKPQELN